MLPPLALPPLILPPSVIPPLLLPPLLLPPLLLAPLVPPQSVPPQSVPPWRLELVLPWRLPLPRALIVAAVPSRLSASNRSEPIGWLATACILFFLIEVTLFSAWLADGFAAALRYAGTGRRRALAGGCAGGRGTSGAYRWMVPRLSSRWRMSQKTAVAALRSPRRSDAWSARMSTPNSARI